jgi:FkbM family methyltransferase
MNKLIDGWWVPEADEKCFHAVMAEVDKVFHVAPKCQRRRSCIQAGGNVGIFPKALSKFFETVYTFELDPMNFGAMQDNCIQIDNIIMRNAALTDFHGMVGVDRIKPNNVGAHQVKLDGDIHTVMIDDLGLEDLDLLWLDIEGSEHSAILGATETINYCSPIVVLELKGLGERYGYSDQQTFDLMESLGYKISQKISRDYIFVRG